MKKFRYFKGFFFFFISFLVCNAKLVSLHNLVKSELFNLLEIWRYKQKKVQNVPNSQKKDPLMYTANWTLLNSRCTLHLNNVNFKIHCTLHSAFFTLLSTIIALHTAHCTLDTGHCILHSGHYTLHTANCTLNNCTLHTAKCMLHTARCTLRVAFTSPQWVVSYNEAPIYWRLKPGCLQCSKAQL